MKSSISSISPLVERSALYWGALWLVLLIFTVPAYAHKVNIFAWVEGDRVYTESKFSGGRKAKNATVEVHDPQGKKLLRGKTDDNGEFAFDIPQKSELKVVLVASTGHRGEWIIPIDEIASGISSQPVSESHSKVEPPDIKVNPQPVKAPCPSADEIQSVVGTALDKKLRPIIKQMRESGKDSPSVSDIFGGIGYIVGLVGVAAYINSRKKDRRKKRE